MGNKIDGIATGEKLYRKMVDAWLEAALVSFELAGDAEAKREFRAAFGRNPAHIIRAVTRFPDVFKPENNPDLFDILAAIHLSRVKDDAQADELFKAYRKSHSYDDLKEAVNQAKRGKPRAQKSCPHCGKPLKVSNA